MQSRSAILCSSEIALRGQKLQSASPFSGLKVFCAQTLQTWPSGPVKPALQTQSVMASLCAKELVFAGHASHDAAADMALKVSVAQDTHDPALTIISCTPMLA